MTSMRSRHLLRLRRHRDIRLRATAPALDAQVAAEHPASLRR
jgi:hypothetical protein